MGIDAVLVSVDIEPALVVDLVLVVLDGGVRILPETSVDLLELMELIGRVLRFGRPGQDVGLLRRSDQGDQQQNAAGHSGRGKFGPLPVGHPSLTSYPRALPIYARHCATAFG